MAKWRVYNTHPMGYTHKEMFKGNMLEIPAGQFVLMDYEDAVQFRGQFFPIKLRGDNTQDPISFKCIKIEADGDLKLAKEDLAKEATKIYVCHLDGKEFSSKDELEKYVSEKYADRVFVDEGLEEQLMKENKAKKAKA